MAERFTRWNDLKEGTNPFVPHRVASPSNVLVRVVKALVGVAFLVLRLPILVVLFLLLAVVATAIRFVRPRAVQRFLRFLLESPLCYLCLLFLGFYAPRASVMDSRRLHLPRVKAPKPTNHPRGGDIILANSSSFVDVLYMGYKYSPTFVRTVTQSDDGLEEVSIVTALLSAFAPAPTASSGVRPAADVIRSARGPLASPIVVQPEGCRSNGRAVLAFSRATAAIGAAVAAMPAASRPAVHTLVFKYPFSFFSPTHTANRPLPHLLRLCSQIYNRMAILSVPAASDPQPSRATLATWPDTVRTAMVQTLGDGARPVAFGAADFNEFWEAYRDPSKRTKKRVRVD